MTSLKKFYRQLEQIYLIRKEMRMMKQKIATFAVGMAFVFIWVGLPVLVGLLVETIVL